MESSNIHLPPGFRFHPSDEELIVFYLRNKANSHPIPASIVAEVDLYKYNPWELPKKALFGEEEWFFFSPRDRKYPKGERPNRAAASGYWKATGTDKPILTTKGSQSIGVKKALVFYKGGPPKGVKTNWIMHEYRLLDNTIKPSRSRSSMRLDDWVLCRVRQKDNVSRNTWQDYNMSIVQPPPSKIDIIENYRNNGCPMLAYILSSNHDVPCIGTNSNLSLQGSNGGTNSPPVYEDISNIDNFFNPLKRKVAESPLSSSKKIYTKSIDSLSFYDQSLPQDDVFGHSEVNLGIEFQELNTSFFMGRDLL